jgi:hypothetical protein
LADISNRNSEDLKKINLSLFSTGDDHREKILITFAQSLSTYGVDFRKINSPEFSGEGLPYLALSADDRPRHFYQALPAELEWNPFSELLSTLMTGKTSLSQYSHRILEKINNPLTIRVLITSSCHFCAEMVGLVNQIAAACPMISAWIIDLELYPEKFDQYRPKAAPTTILGDEVRLTGLVPEKELSSWLEKLDSRDYLADLYRNDLLEKRMADAVKRLKHRPVDISILAGLLRAEEFGIKLGAMAVMEALIEDEPLLQGIILDSLLPLLQNESDLVVGDTAYLIGLLQDDRKTNLLTNLLSHPNPEVVEVARDGLEGR